MNLSLKEQKRQRGLARRKVVSESTLEKQQITTLVQQNNLQKIQTDLDLVPANMKYLQAQLESAKASLAQAQLDLEHTVIEAPFDCRVDKVNIEISQYVQMGQEMFKVDCIDVAEVAAQVDMGRLGILVMDETVEPGQAVLASGKYVSLPQRLGLTAIIKYSPNGKTFQWNANCERLEPIDPNTRTVGIVVVVNNPYTKIVGKPPLVKGMYCEVDIYGRKQADCIIIPRSAIHDGKVYKVTADKRLEVKKIEVKYAMLDFAVIKKGLKKGDVVVCSDLVPAINGMLLDVTTDVGLEQRIKKAANSGGIK